MDKSKRDKILLAILAIVIIGLVMFYVSVKPSIDEIKTLNIKIESARESIQSLQGKSTLINELKKQLAELELEVQEAEGDMPRFDDYALYLSDFQDITDGTARETSISFTSTAPSESGYYVLVQAKVAFKCTYDDLKYIMNAMLEHNVHCYDVSVVVSNLAADGNPTELTVKFTADYISGSGIYTPGDYDFTSGQYGLSQLFDGVVMGATVTPVAPENP